MADLERIAAREPDLRKDLDIGFRFLHQMLAGVRQDVLEASYTVLALVEELLERGAVDIPGLGTTLARVQEREMKRIEEHVRVRVEQSIDKYQLGSPDVPCQELIPLCRGRCCSLHFPLSKQDLDERVVKWAYDLPYIIRQDPVDHYCVHNDRATRGCHVYHNRPAVCRTYDCRADKRIWLDYAKRIPTIDPGKSVTETPVPAGIPPTKPWTLITE
jgi:Fe-S-cluster containining protein